MVFPHKGSLNLCTELLSVLCRHLELLVRQASHIATRQRQALTRCSQVTHKQRVAHALRPVHTSFQPRHRHSDPRTLHARQSQMKAGTARRWALHPRFWKCRQSADGGRDHPSTRLHPRNPQQQHWCPVMSAAAPCGAQPCLCAGRCAAITMSSPHLMHLQLEISAMGSQSKHRYDCSKF